jgi:hypothetical protein
MTQDYRVSRLITYEEHKRILAEREQARRAAEQRIKEEEDAQNSNA